MKVDPWAGNPYGVSVQPIDYSDANAPWQKTYHGLTIVSGGYIVGRITSWNPAEFTRDVVHTYELSFYTFGRPVDQSPGRCTGYTISGTSAEMWDYEIEKRLAGDPDLAVFDDLCDQVRAFTIYEHWFKGVNPYRTWAYYGCWLTSKGDDAFSAEGDGRYLTNFTLQYVSKRGVL